MELPCNRRPQKRNCSEISFRTASSATCCFRSEKVPSHRHLAQNGLARERESSRKFAATRKLATNEVTGYADSTGSAAMNTKLSEDRAKAGVIYLVQQGSVPIRHIVAPGAMGEYGPAAPNETKAGRSENHRVEVKVLVNKGIAGN